MKISFNGWAAVVALFSIGLSGQAAESSPPSSIATQAKFPAPIYDFGQVLPGEIVKHSFKFTNPGKGILQISNVEASCGCTTTGNWPRELKPGKSGSIPVQFNSGQFEGQVNSSVVVSFMDPAQPPVVLHLTGKVIKVFEVTPRKAIIRSSGDYSSNAVVHIVNQTKKRITLGEPESNNGAFSASLETVQPGKEFRLNIKTAPSLETGQTSGLITLKASATNLPPIVIPVAALVEPTIIVRPAKILLPPSSDLHASSYAISIRNAGADPLTLSEASVNSPDVPVKVREVEPGKRYSISVNFPKGFAVPHDGHLEFSVKSSSARNPVIKIPIEQSAVALQPHH